MRGSQNKHAAHLRTVLKTQFSLLMPTDVHSYYVGQLLRSVCHLHCFLANGLPVAHFKSVKLEEFQEREKDRRQRADVVTVHQPPGRRRPQPRLLSQAGVCCHVSATGDSV